MHQQIQTFLSENMIILLYSRYDELKLLIILAFYQPSTKQLIIASRTQQLGWRKLPDIWINRVTLRWISTISLRTFQFFNGYFLWVNPKIKMFSSNSQCLVSVTILIKINMDNVIKKNYRKKSENQKNTTKMFRKSLVYRYTFPILS